MKSTYVTPSFFFFFFQKKKGEEKKREMYEIDVGCLCKLGRHWMSDRNKKERIIR